MSGWIKTHRSILEWEWYTDANTFRLFLHLLLKATHKPAKYMGCSLSPGDVVTGYSALGEQLGLSIKQIRVAMKKLEKTGEVAINSTNKFSII